MIHLYLVRHGECEGKGLYIGRGTDVPLAEEGQNQISSLSEKLIQELQNNLILGLTILLVGIVYISIRFSRTLTEPIELLSQTASDLALGNLDISIQMDTQDEIGDLSNSFETMRLELKKSINDLEDINLNLEGLVDERTKELETETERVRIIIEMAPDAVITIV